MLTPEHIRHTLDQYMAAINAGDVSAVMALYADDAAVEDPAGTEPKRGDEIVQLYTNALSGGAKVQLTGPRPHFRQNCRLPAPGRNLRGRWAGHDR